MAASMGHWLRLWFGFTLPVDRQSYALSGFGLMALKYALEACAAWHFAGVVYTPLDFLNPELEERNDAFGHPAPSWLSFAVLASSLPFLWVALSMSIRRAVDAGHRPVFGAWILVPFANLVAMLYLAARPSDPRARWLPPAHPEATAPVLRSAALGIAAGILIVLAAVPIAVFAAGEYGASLFLATPLVSATVAAYLFNRPFGFSLKASLAVAQVTVLLSGLGVLLFALEGAICVAMAWPVAAVMALLGGMLGHLAAARSVMRGADLGLLLCCLPLLMGAERWAPPPPLREVVTATEVDAPPEVVWRHVVSFGEIAGPPPWYFAAGIAYPVRAAIDGAGVGAVRRCEFSTGAFVEPITAWEPPRRLAFDVSAQPPPMRELSPWGDIAAPHLEGTLRSRRGEFRLIALAGGRTRLEGSTWYTLDMGPQAYWSLWSDALIGRIHGRVLEHVARLAEGDAAECRSR